jgi:secreted trypsin-like serine protease
MDKFVLILTTFVVTSLPLIAICNKNENPCVDNYYKWRLIGGQTAQPGEFPFMANLRNESNGFWGGASIISNKWLVTAAHCVYGYTPANLSVEVGSNLLSTGGTPHKLRTIVINPNYDPVTAENDIALMELENEIIFDSLTQPIELGPGVENDSSVVLGWGLVQWGVYPEELQFLPTRVTPVEECTNYWESLVGTQVCAFSKDGQGVCCGDSGGPLVSSEGKLVGIVSYGVPCAVGSPDIYTRLSAFSDWITQSTQTVKI